MDQDQKALLIIAKLIERIGAGLDQWTEDVNGFLMCKDLPLSDDEEGFVICVINEIPQQRDEPGGYEFHIFKPKRIKIFSLRCELSAGPLEDLELMRKLYFAVRSNYYDTPAILDQIIADLESK